MWTRLRRLSVLAVLALTSFACSPSGSAPTGGAVEGADADTQAAATSGPAATPQSESPAELDPCAVQTQSDAEALFGEPVGAGVSSAVGPFLVCTYEPVDASGGVLSFMVWPATTASTFETTVAETEQQMGAEALAVSGVGDQAYYLTGALHVLHEGYYLQYVLLKTMGDEEAVAAFSELANQAIARLP